MRVLERGRNQKGWAEEYFCTGKGNGLGGCRAKLLVEQGDLFVTSSSDYGGGTDYFTTFKCSECGILTDVEDCPIRTASLPTKATWLESRNLEQ